VVSVTVAPSELLVVQLMAGWRSAVGRDVQWDLMSQGMSRLRASARWGTSLCRPGRN